MLSLHSSFRKIKIDILTFLIWCSVVCFIVSQSGVLTIQLYNSKLRPKFMEKRGWRKFKMFKVENNWNKKLFCVLF